MFRSTAEARCNGYAGPMHMFHDSTGLGGRVGENDGASQKDIEEMAHEPVELYANRELVHRTSHGKDSMLYHEFGGSLEYEETLTRGKPSKTSPTTWPPPNRWTAPVCGDVGYGKTEVAMRRYLPWLRKPAGRRPGAHDPPCPSALRQFRRTVRALPTRVGLLSRFQSPKDTKAIIKDMAAGLVDVLIGTHRLLQKDAVSQPRLVIIDEEQWFGVKHKERLETVAHPGRRPDLTATPIPRTPQMTMTVCATCRSSITPPSGRLAIRTQVRIQRKAIREAILRELGCGGQNLLRA